jgi:hypothetical protein
LNVLEGVGGNVKVCVELSVGVRGGVEVGVGESDAPLIDPLSVAERDALIVLLKEKEPEKDSVPVGVTPLLEADISSLSEKLRESVGSVSVTAGVLDLVLERLLDREELNSSVELKLVDADHDRVSTADEVGVG